MKKKETNQPTSEGNPQQVMEPPTGGQGGFTSTGGRGALPCLCFEPLNMQRAATRAAAMPHVAACAAACPVASRRPCSAATYSISCRNDVFFTLRNSV